MGEETRRFLTNHQFANLFRAGNYVDSSQLMQAVDQKVTSEMNEMLITEF